MKSNKCTFKNSNFVLPIVGVSGALGGHIDEDCATLGLKQIGLTK